MTRAAGSTHAKAAEAAGVDRVTVSRWATRHPEFRAELNRRRKELREQRVARVLQLDNAALDVVQKRIEGGDAATALQWIKARDPKGMAVDDVGLLTSEEILEDLTKQRCRRAEQDLLASATGGLSPDPSHVRERIEAELLAELGPDDQNAVP